MLLKFTKLKKPNNSLRGRFAVYIVSVIVIFVALIIFLLGAFGILNPAKKQISSELDGLLQRYSAQIEHDIDELASCAISLSQQLEDDLQGYLSRKNLAFDELKNNAEALDELQREMYDILYLNMQVAHPSGAFFILNTSPDTGSKDPGYSGVYLKYINLFSENTVNNDFTLYRGSFATGHANSVSFHSGWRSGCQTDFFEKSSALFKKGRHYALSYTVDIPDTWERARYVYVPVFDIRDEIVGVCGFEINDLLFNLSYKADDSRLGLIVCGLLDKKVKGYDGQFNSGRYTVSAQNPQTLNLIENSDLVKFDFGTETCIGKTKSLTLGADTFVMAVMMPKASYDKIIEKEQLKFVSIFLIITILALGCCIYMSKKYISPVIRKIEQIKSKEKPEEKLKIAEIDDLFVFLEKKDLRVEKQLKELEEAKHSALEEASKTKLAYETALKECELAQIEIERLSESNQCEIVTQDYDYFISNLGTLTVTESKIYELYLEGKKASEIAEIMGIKPNTLKYHNKNIYSKLGISSRKQLLKYATLKKYQDKSPL